MRSLFTILLTLAIVSVMFVQNGIAQIPITYYDLENNTTRTTGEATVEQTINSNLNNAITWAGITQSYYTGSGTAFGGTSAGMSIGGTSWATSTSDPGTGATKYIQFSINTSGFSGISISFVAYRSALGPSRLGINYSTNGGTNWSSISYFGLTNGTTWYQFGTDFPAAFNDQPNIIIRLYGYYAILSSGTLRIDNIEFDAYSTVSGAGNKTTLNEDNIYTSFTSGGTGSDFLRDGFNLTGSGTTLIIRNHIFISPGTTFSVTANATLDFGTNSENPISYGGNFNLGDGCTMIINSANGITSGLTASGNIQVTGTRTYSSLANYIYRATPPKNISIVRMKVPESLNFKENQQNIPEINIKNEKTVLKEINTSQSNDIIFKSRVKKISVNSSENLQSAPLTSQVTGDGLPSDVNNLTINNSAGVTQNSTLVSSVYTSFYSQGFNGSPTGWTTAVVTNAGSAGTPSISYVSTSSNPAGFTPTEGTLMGLFNSFTCDAGDQIRLYQTTPISTIGITGTTVKFNWTTDNVYTNTDNVTIQYSTNGTTWINGSRYYRYGTTQWNTDYCGLPSGADNQATLYIGLLFTSGYGNDCHFDNLSVGSWVKTLTPQLTVNGNLDLQNGNLTIGSNTLILNGTVSGNSSLVGGIASNLTVSGSGTNLTLPSITNGLQDLTINRANGVTLNNYLTISGTLSLANGLLTLGANNLTIDPGSINGGSASSYVVTNGAGQLKRTVSNNDTYILFPVGLSAYNPLNIKLDAASTTDIFGVKVSDAIANSGYDPTKIVNRQWDITKATGNASNATIQFQFNAGEGITDYTSGQIGHWNGTSYDEIASSITGSGPYIITNMQLITSFSPFIVGNIYPMPVELASFTSNVISRDVKLNWTTATETNNAGFEIQKSEIRSQKSLQKNGEQAGDWTKVGYITGNGTKTTPTNYSFDDRKLNIGKYHYRLKQIDYNGNFEYHNLNSIVEIGVPNKFDISQNYPNPFNPTTKIDFNLPYDSKVSMKLYDISGREVMTLMNETKTAGYYTVQLNGNNLSSGMYFYRIIAEGNGQKYEMTKKAMFIK